MFQFITVKYSVRMAKRVLRFILTLLCLGSSNAYTQSYDLSYYLENSRSNSPLLRDYQNQVELNKIDSAVLRATMRPQVNGNAQVMVAPAINGYGYDPSITNGGLYMALIGVSQNILNRNIL